MRFEVRALSPANSISRLDIEAASEDEAVQQAEGRGLRVLAVRRQASAGWRRRVARNGFSLLLFSQELHALLKAGLNLVEAMQGLVEKEGANHGRNVLDHLIGRIRGGQRLSSALGELPETFPPLFIGLMQAAESTGDLPTALSRYIDYRQRVDAVRGKVLSASIYPAILLIVGGGVTLFLGGYVVPRFASIYQDTGRDLPAASKLLLAFGQLVEHHAFLISISMLGVLAMAILGIRHLARRGALMALVIRLPWVGMRVRLYELSRLYLTLGLLLESGIPVVGAMDMADGVVSSAARTRLATARREIQAGDSFAATLAEHHLTTPISLRMLRVGEQSGQLGAMLMQASAFHDGDVSRFIDRFTRAFEPVLMAVIGVVVGGIVLLLYLPIFDLAGSLQ